MSETDTTATGSEQMQGEGHTEEALPSPSYVRLAVATTLLFILSGLALFFGARRTDAIPYAAVGVVAFLVVGRIFGLQGNGEWVRGVVAFAMALFVSYIIGAVIFNQL